MLLYPAVERAKGIRGADTVSAFILLPAEAVVKTKQK